MPQKGCDMEEVAKPSWRYNGAIIQYTGMCRLPMW